MISKGRGRALRDNLARDICQISRTRVANHTRFRYTLMTQKFDQYPPWLYNSQMVVQCFSNVQLNTVVEYQV